MKVQTLADLKQLRREMQRRAEQEAAARAAAEAARRAALERAEQDRRLFERAVGPVQRLPPHGRIEHAPPAPPPWPRQRQLDERAVMREALSDAFDAETLLHTDEHLSFRRPGLGPDVVRRLRRGEWAIQAELDLHGLRTDEARERLGGFIRDAHRQGLRCVRVVHGKGLGSPGKTPVLKGRVHGWLVQKSEVLAFVQARPADGGAGALIVLLRATSHGRA
ncbi:putative DNA endonuclease SmrA [Tepidimonas alkaliphilus]|uniref:Putative DNA endonuclease SmrA n=1 Tax=Tepidimonas alkaliphilus TaxID=2588942 RepID=A0A554W4Q4_9BURK|nr:Smr/MutS family protein [Tepidimonas alkaliphilus]TSE18557.1 putative DNA endonuclease SmrA [Tepidimonas alkaliphilus]